jgi:hypothetical protein
MTKAYLLQPLPLDALREPSFEALFADQNFVEFNPIQTQVTQHAQCHMPNDTARLYVVRLSLCSPLNQASDVWLVHCAGVQYAVPDI